MKIRMAAFCALASLACMSGCAGLDFGTAKSQAVATRNALQQETDTATAQAAAAQAAAAQAAASGSDAQTVQRLQDAANASEARRDKMQRVNDPIVKTLDKAIPAAQQAADQSASGDVTAALTTAGGLLPPPWGTVLLLGGSIGTALYQTVTKKRIADGLSSLVDQIERVKSENPTFKQTLKDNAARIEANITDVAKAAIADAKIN